MPGHVKDWHSVCASPTGSPAPLSCSVFCASLSYHVGEDYTGGNGQEVADVQRSGDVGVFRTYLISDYKICT